MVEVVIGEQRGEGVRYSVLYLRMECTVREDGMNVDADAIVRKENTIFFPWRCHFKIVHSNIHRRLPFKKIFFQNFQVTTVLNVL